MNIQSIKQCIKLCVYCALFTAAALAARPAQADLSLGTAPSSALAGGTGSFDVTLTDVGGSFDVAGFSFELTVPGGSGLMFTNADMSTVGPLIFAGNSFDTFFSVPFSLSTFPTTDVNGSDLANSGSTTLSTGSVFDLGNIDYSVAPGTAPGPVTVSIILANGNTSLSDSNGDPVAFSAVPGEITVDSPGSATPEPGAFAMLAGLGVSAAGFLHRRKRRREV